MELLMSEGLLGNQSTPFEMTTPSYWVASFKSVGLLSHFIPILVSLPTKTIANKKVFWQLLRVTSLFFGMKKCRMFLLKSLDKPDGQKQLGELLKKLIDVVGSTITGNFIILVNTSNYLKK